MQKAMQPVTDFYPKMPLNAHANFSKLGLLCLTLVRVRPCCNRNLAEPLLFGAVLDGDSGAREAGRF